MLWYKSWLDTRWRFLIALLVLAVMACGVVASYNFSRSLLPALADRPIDTSTTAGRLLKEALRIEQTYRGFELVVLDNASPDNTGEIARSFGDPRVRVVSA